MDTRTRMPDHSDRHAPDAEPTQNRRMNNLKFFLAATLVLAAISLIAAIGGAISRHTRPPE